MTAAYERGWNQLTTAHYSQTEWPSEELIAPLVNDGTSPPPFPCWPVPPASPSNHVEDTDESLFVVETVRLLLPCRPNLPHPLPRAVVQAHLRSPPTQH